MSDRERLPWESEGDLPWASNEAGWEPLESDPWRGDVHLDQWPEELAGPEYWLYKKMGEEEV